MRYLLVLPLVVLFLTGCSKTDREQINGTWAFHELKGPNGKVAYSADKAEQKKITDEMVKEQMAMYAGAEVNETMLREMATKQFDAIGKITFTFNDKGIAKVETHSEDKSRDDESKFTLDEKKKTITIKSEARDITYKYNFKDDKVVMKGEQEEFTLIRKS